MQDDVTCKEKKRKNKSIHFILFRRRTLDLLHRTHNLATSTSSLDLRCACSSPPTRLALYNPNMAFIPSSFHLLPSRQQYLTKSSQKRPLHRFRSALKSPQEPVKPRFWRDEAAPETTFFSDRAAQTNNAPATPNERVLQQVRDTMNRLGIQEQSDVPPPPTFAPIDISGVNPFSALLGAAGAAAISYAAWSALVFIASFFASHPLDEQIYVVQRLGAVVRTALVCLLALGSGISGVTSLGLFLLSVRTGYGKLSGEFERSNEQSSRAETQ